MWQVLGFVFVLVLSIGSLGLVGFLLVNSPSPRIFFGRLGAVGLGFLLFLGSKILNVSAPELYLSAVDVFGDLKGALISNGISGGAGAVAAFVLLKSANNQKMAKSTDFNSILVFCCFLSFMYLDLYAAAVWGTSSEMLGPNISFSVAVLALALFGPIKVTDLLEPAARKKEKRDRVSVDDWRYLDSDDDYS